jgi:hypothetical protein
LHVSETDDLVLEVVCGKVGHEDVALKLEEEACGGIAGYVDEFADLDGRSRRLRMGDGGVGGCSGAGSGCSDGRCSEGGDPFRPGGVLGAVCEDGEVDGAGHGGSSG